MTPEETKQFVITFCQYFEAADSEVTYEKKENGDIAVTILCSDPRHLIGKDGQNFEAFSHLVKRVAMKSSTEDIRFSIDVNNYLDEKKKKLHTMAKMLGDRAKSLGSAVELEPMNSYERLLIHMYFEDKPEFKTESQGVGLERRVVIRHVGVVENELAI